MTMAASLSIEGMKWDEESRVDGVARIAGRCARHWTSFVTQAGVPLPNASLRGAHQLNGAGVLTE